MLLNIFSVRCFAQQTSIQIDSVTIAGYSNDSIDFNLYATFLGSYFLDVIEYEEKENCIIVNARFSEYHFHADCYCQTLSTFKIKKDKYAKVQVKVMYRLFLDGTEDNPVYGEYMNMENDYVYSFEQQQYKRCLEEGTVKWSVLYDRIDEGLGSMEWVAYGDTLINNVLYKKLYEESEFKDFEESNFNWKNYTPSLKHISNFFIRESEDASKMYIFDSWENKEYLISDLDLQEGDEIEIETSLHTFTALIDSVYIKDGLKHVRTDLAIFLFPDHKLTFTESIGPNAGILFFYRGGGVVLNCFQNQSFFYKNRQIDEYSVHPCGYCWETNAVRTVSKENYRLRVKENRIEMSFPDNSPVNVSLYDIHGRMYYTKENFFGSGIIIPASHYPKGVYIIKIFDKNKNQINISKIIL
jgi:hypothetical protein